MLLDEVRDALDESARLVPQGLVEPGEVLTRARRKVRRRRVAQVAAATLVLVSMIGAIVAVAAHHSSPAPQVVVAAPTTTTVLSGPDAGVSAEQLAAHLGVGVPTGWVPVDYGDARLFVPRGWVLEGRGTCVKNTNAPGLISTGPSGCGSGPDPAIPSVVVTALGSKHPSIGTVVKVVHGYSVYERTDVDEPAGAVFFVPQLGVTIAMSDSLQNTVLPTLAPSARNIALQSSRASDASGQEVATDGVRMTVPSAWSVTTPQFLPCSWPGSVAGVGPQVVRITATTGVPPCPGPGFLVGGTVRDGVFLFVGETPLAPQPDGTLLAELHHGSTTVRAYTEAGDANALDVFARLAGSPTTHVLQLGLGLDGRVAGQVLASIQATR